MVRGLLVSLALLAGCGSAYTQVGYQVARRATGPAATAVAGGDPRSGSLAIGFGTQAVAMEINLQGHGVEMAADPWVAASAGLELKLRPLRYGPFSAFVHAGPQRAVLLDRSSLEMIWGAGYAYGGGIAVGKAGLSVVLGARADEVWYAGPAGTATAGTCSTRTLTIGLQLGH